ncbi:MAG: Mrp/NBP35 family ATP-binding protein [Coriobacteriales bacterium]|jgi:Mrp family chromosome partitioning ATPase|nr:Mrp/NBP35 family ATP-binding protein [Coriobacteriales bacterium]
MDAEKKDQVPEDCEGVCSSCETDCASRDSGPPPKAPLLEDVRIGRTIAVASGKGGVGKSLVTLLLATALRRQGQRVGILDADITGPSIPRALGVEERLRADARGILPSVSEGGIEVVSTNLILPADTTPVIWRGSIISGMVRQFYSEVVWGELDVLLIDMPPGTGDVPLTVYQSLPIEGVLIVTAPQALVSMIVGKAINMARTMDVEVLGLVENMAYYECPDCGASHEVFGKSTVDEMAAEYDISLVARVPVMPDFARHMDDGSVESLASDALGPLASALVAPA